MSQRPHVQMHMMTTIDGRIEATGWPLELQAGDIYEDIHQDLKADAWIVGPSTMAEFSVGDPKPVVAQGKYERATWISPVSGAGPYAVAIDRRGRLHLNTARVNGDPIICVLTEAVSDDHLAELRRDNISYFFAGEEEIDLSLALQILRETFGINKLLLEGGGVVNAAFLNEDLIDEVSLLILPIVDGRTYSPSLFDRSGGVIERLRLLSVNTLNNGIVHIRYQFTDNPSV